MDRGARQATVHGISRVGHDLVIKTPPCPHTYYSNRLSYKFILVVFFSKKQSSMEQIKSYHSSNASKTRLITVIKKIG